MTILTRAGRRNEFLRSSNMISRQSSVSLSSRIYYRSSGAAGFPFTWEMLPGEPKQKPTNYGHVPQPLSPPPALHSLTLPKPSIQKYIDNKKSSSKLLLWKLWKKMSKKMKKKQSKYNDVEVKREDTGFWRPESSYYSSPCSASSYLSPSSSGSSPVLTTEYHNRNMANVEQPMSGAKPFARASRRISRMVVACAPGTKRG